jgi:hypothetical protein
VAIVALCLAVPASAAAAEPPLGSVSPTALNFGKVRYGTTSAPKQVTLTNTNLFVPLFPWVRTVAGPAAADYVLTASNCPIFLAPGTSCTVDVVFRPRASAVRNATLRIETQPGGGAHLVPLTGRGCLILIGTLCLL